MVDEGLFEFIIRIESPLDGGLGDFKGVSQIPDVIYDRYQNREIEVTPELLHPIYVLKLDGCK